MKARIYAVLAATLLTVVIAFPLSLPDVRATHLQSHNLLWIRDYRYDNYINSDPHGKLNVLVSIHKLLSDSTGSNDWYFYHVQVQSVPGAVAYGCYWSSCQWGTQGPWETANHDAYHEVFNYGPWRELVDYDPTSTNGFTTSTVSASVTVSDKPAFSFTKSDSYTIPYVNAIDWSDYSLHRARWNHDFNEQADPTGSPSDSTFRVRPWFVVKTAQDGSSLVDGHYHIGFAHWVCGWTFNWYHCWWESQGFTGPTKYLDAQRSGDS